MQVRKTVIVTAAVAAIGLGALGATASAQTDSGGTTLVDKIAQQFNLKKEDVQKVFDQHKTERRATMEARYEERLNQAVKDGKLTEEQKTKILAKHKELMKEIEADREANKGKREDFQNKTEAERKALMEQRKAEMDKKKSEIEAWEKENNIPTGYLMFGGGQGGMRGPGGPGHGPGEI